MRPARRYSMLLGTGLVALAACSGTTAATTTAATTTTTVTTTTVPETTTSTTPSGPTELPATAALSMTPGNYVAPGFWSPMTIGVEDPGWYSMGSRELWIYLQYLEPGHSSFDLDLSVVAHSPTRSVEEVAARIADSSDAEVVRPAEATTLAGYPAVTLDVIAPESPLSGGYCGNSSTGNSRFQDNEIGLFLMTDDSSPTYGYAFGVRTCREARIWVVDVDGTTITIIAATTRPDQFEDLMPLAERLVAGIEFGA